MEYTFICLSTVIQLLFALCMAVWLAKQSVAGIRYMIRTMIREEGADE